MYEKIMTYTDFNGEKRTETFNFNLTKAELAEIELSTVGGLEMMLNRIVSAQDMPSLVSIFKEFILKSYGERSLDGRKFVKKTPDGHRLADDFEATNAYSDLFIELATNTESAIAFFNGIIPAELREEVEKAQKNQGAITGPTTENNITPIPTQE